MTAYIIGTKGPSKGLVFDLQDKEEWTLGSDKEEVDFLVEDDTLLAIHVKISKTEEGFFLESFEESSSCLINGKPLEGASTLKEGDLLSIGKSLFVFSKKSRQIDENTAAFDAIFEDDQQAKEEPTIGETSPMEEEEDLETYPPYEEEEEKTAYDTIFEEGTEEDPLPFNLLNDSPLILKVIAGPNAGAEIGLDKGKSYIIGKDPTSADIVFQDLSVSRKHGKITITADGEMSIEDLGARNKTLVNGASIDAPTKISGQDIISTGTTTFLIIDREADMQTIYAPETGSLDSAPVEEKEEEKEPVSWKKETIPTSYLAFAGTFVFTLLLLFLSLFSLFQKTETKPASFRSQKKQIEEFLANYHDLTFTYSKSSGKVFVVGHVATAIRKRALLHQIENLSFVRSIEENIIVDEAVTRAINTVLVENMGMQGVSIHNPKEGVFIATGYLATEQELADLTAYLHSNFPYADRLENHVVVETSLRQEVQNMIVSEGFSGLQMKITNGVIVLGGLYDGKKTPRYQDLLRNLRKVRGIRGLKNLAVATSETATRIDLSQNYQVSGFAEYNHLNYNVIINGQIMRKGEILNGMRITSILPDTILLEKNGLKYKIYYTR